MPNGLVKLYLQKFILLEYSFILLLAKPARNFDKSRDTHQLAKIKLDSFLFIPQLLICICRRLAEIKALNSNVFMIVYTFWNG